MDGTGREMEILDSYLPVLEFMLRNLFAHTGLRLLRLPIAGTVEAENIRTILEDDLAETIPVISLHGVHPDFQF